MILKDDRTCPKPDNITFFSFLCTDKFIKWMNAIIYINSICKMEGIWSMKGNLEKRTKGTVKFQDYRYL